MSDITDRLKDLAHAAADQNWGEFSMRVPADHAGDADLVLLAASKEITSLRAELERERMRLAACGVVAMANTPESAARARDIHPDYRSASCDDVARAVDSEMSLRAELAELRKPDCLTCQHYGMAGVPVLGRCFADDCSPEGSAYIRYPAVRLYEEAMHDMRFRVHARLLLVEAGCELMSLADSRLTPIANLLEERERFFLRVHELEGRAKRSPEDVGFTTD